MQIRTATLDDAEALRAIYNHYVVSSAATFDLEERTPADQLEWMADRSGAMAVLVAVEDSAVEERAADSSVGSETILGFASLSPYKARAAYRTTVENSVYLDPAAVGRGIGSALMNQLVDVARQHGFHAIIARVNASLEASVGLHKSVGFETVGIERQIGRKFGKWHDVHVLQLLL